MKKYLKWNKNCLNLHIHFFNFKIMQKRVKIFLSILFLFSTNILFSQYSPKIDSIIKLTESSKDDTSKVTQLRNLSLEIKSMDIDKAVEYGTQSIELAQKLKFKYGEAESLKNLGGIYYSNSNYSKAYEYYNKSIVVFEELKDTVKLSKLISNIGSIFSQQGDYENALKYFFESLKMKQALNDQKGIATTYNAIGLVFASQGKDFNEDAFKYYNDALTIYQKLNDKSGIAKSYYRIGILKNGYEELDTTLVLDYLYKFLNLSIELKDENSMAQANGAIGKVYLNSKKLDSAYVYLTKSLNAWEKLNSPFEIATNYLSFGDYYLQKKNATLCLDYLNKAIKISYKVQSLDIRKSAYLTLRIIYERTGNYKLALEYADKYNKASDSLQNKNLADKITKMELKKNFEREMLEKENEQKIAQQQTELENEAKLKRQRMITLFFTIALLFMIAIAVLVLRSNRQKHRANQLLKAQHNEIMEKNAKLHQQNEEIETQRDEIEIQLNRVTKLKEEVEKQKQHVTDSIIYAKRIQQALLPPEEMINAFFTENFIIFKPRDIVSGDFYWFARKDNLAIITAADCTGHGVPGAFMSMLGISFLNEIINDLKINEINAGVILTTLRRFVKTSLRQTGKDNEAKDGMDMALCVIDSENKKLHYSGAHNPLIFIHNNELTHYKADKMPIGIHIRETDFSNNEIIIENGDLFYIFSDGFVDQFGGLDGKKLMIKHFKDKILEFHNLEMEAQKEEILNLFDNWIAPNENRTNGYEQIDDVCVIGCKINFLTS